MNNKRYREQAARTLKSNGFEQDGKLFKKGRITVSISVFKFIGSDNYLYVVVEDDDGNIVHKLELNEKEIGKLNEIDTLIEGEQDEGEQN